LASSPFLAPPAAAASGFLTSYFFSSFLASAACGLSVDAANSIPRSS